LKSPLSLLLAETVRALFLSGERDSEDLVRVRKSLKFSS